MVFQPYNESIGGFSPNDGTIDFYLRISSLLRQDDTLLDLGAGRAAWFDDDRCEVRKNIRLIKGKIKKVVAADIDKAVLHNKASDVQIHITNDTEILLPQPVDIIVADYVLEHIEKPENFFHQVNNSLKNGGWFCARTPHSLSYVSLAARLVNNSFHSKLLYFAQPDRKEIDIFPTFFRLNSLSTIDKTFKGWNNKSFIFKTDPAYYFGNKIIYQTLYLVHKVLPKFACGNIFLFLQKPK